MIIEFTEFSFIRRRLVGNFGRKDWYRKIHHRIKVSVKENEVPTEKNSSRARIVSTKASYISN